MNNKFHNFSLIFLLFICYSQVLFSQKYSVSGYVLDKNTGEVIIGANIIEVNSEKGVSTNKYGFFTLKSQNDLNQFQLQISHIGYKTQILELKLNKDTIINVEIQLADKVLNELTVIAEKKIEEKAEMGRINIPLSTIKTLPSITGEPDILKAYQLLPGIQMGSENNNGLYVRGGSADQNLFLLDDVPLYNVSHLAGFFSVFDPSMVKSVDLYKGGFPARYGGRISSVIDVRNKDGNLYKYKGEIGLGLISGKVFIEGPLKKGESSYAFSYRNCNFGIYSYLFNKFQGLKYTQGYYFNDINFKANIKLSEKNRLFLGFYRGEDNIYYKEKDTKIEQYNIKYSGKSEIKWGNTAGSLRWLHIFDNGIFNNTTLAFTNYNYTSFAESIVESINKSTTDKINIKDNLRLRSGTNDFQIKNDAEIPFDKLILRFGMFLGTHSYIPGIVTYINKTNEFKSDSTNSSNNQYIKALDGYGYAEFDYKISEKLTTNTGFRTGFYKVYSTYFPVFEPRFVLNYLFLPSFSVKASYSKMHQNIHLLTNSNGGLPSDIWVPSTNQIKPESSDQYAIGFAHTSAKDYEFSVELYKKKIENLIEYKQGVLIFSNFENWDTKVEKGGIGKIQGIEFLVRKKTGKLTGWIGYTLSSNTRKFENINNGKEFPYTYDQTHNVSIVGNYEISERLTLSANWVYHTGNCITLPSASYLIFDNVPYTTNEGSYKTIEIYSERNGYRLPNYHRLDLALNHSKQLKKGIRNWSVNIYNVYNRQNAYYVFYKKDDDGNIKLYQRSFFPIILNIGYSYKW